MERCRNCGGEVNGWVCNYCGTLTHAPEDASKEREALDEFHILVSKTEDPEKLETVIKNGFIPQGEAVLIDAALRTVSLFGVDHQADSPAATAAIARLEAIVLKLKVMPQTDAVRRALAELEPRLTEQRMHNKRENRTSMLLGLGCVLVALGACAGGGLLWYWL